MRDDPAKAGKSAHVNSDPSDTDRNHSDTEHDADGNGKVAQCEAHRPNAAISSTGSRLRSRARANGSTLARVRQETLAFGASKGYRPEQGHVSGDYDPPVKRHRTLNPTHSYKRKAPCAVFREWPNTLPRASAEWSARFAPKADSVRYGTHGALSRRFTGIFLDGKRTTEHGHRTGGWAACWPTSNNPVMSLDVRCGLRSGFTWIRSNALYADTVRYRATQRYEWL